MSKLFIVATPIGNLGDITVRAKKVLAEVDVIACEDTRHTATLLAHLGIKKPLVSYYKHKEKEGSVYLADLVEGGKNVALVSDAGMPCISDPGSVLVKELRKRELEYTVCPGACAFVSAIALTGVTGAFTFLGFLPEKNKDKINLISAHKETGANLIFYSAPHDLNKNLDFLYSELGETTVYLVKEITKIYESVKVGLLSVLREEEPKGEYVIICEPAEKKEVSDRDIRGMLSAEISSGKDKKTAVKEVTERLSVPKNRVYKLSLEL